MGGRALGDVGLRAWEGAGPPAASRPALWSRAGGTRAAGSGHKAPGRAGLRSGGGGRRLFVPFH